MLTLITGGSGSGKSEFAENLAVSYQIPHLFYIATMYPYDKEAYTKIERHKRMRQNKNFTTLETYTNLKEVSIPHKGIVLLDCMSNLVANEIFQEDGAKEQVVVSVIEGIKQILCSSLHFIIVTNEVFSDGMVYSKETMQYLSYLGEINQNIATLADEVIEVVYSIPIYHKTKKQ